VNYFSYCGSNFKITSHYNTGFHKAFSNHNGIWFSLRCNRYLSNRYEISSRDVLQPLLRWGCAAGTKKLWPWSRVKSLENIPCSTVEIKWNCRICDNLTCTYITVVWPLRFPCLTTVISTLPSLSRQLFLIASRLSFTAKTQNKSISLQYLHYTNNKKNLTWN